MQSDTKKQKQIVIRPSVLKKAAKVQKKVGATSFSDLIEILINKESEK